MVLRPLILGTLQGSWWAHDAVIALLLQRLIPSAIPLFLCVIELSTNYGVPVQLEGLGFEALLQPTVLILKQQRPNAQ